MELCKEQQIHNFCHPNAIMTLKEYLTDYASDTTKETSKKLILKEINTLKDEKIKKIVLENLEKIENGERDFKF